MRDLEKELRERDQRIDELLEIVRQQTEEIQQLKARVAELEAALGQRKAANALKPPQFSGNYSLNQQENKQSRRRKKKSPGRRPNSLKLSQVQRTQNVYPEGVLPERCSFCRDRFVWRLENGQAVFVCYRLHRANGTHTVATLPDVLPRSEYGLEIAITLAYLVYSLNLSIDQARELLGFFCRLELSASQADLLLNSLAKLWKAEFDALVEMMALATVVYMDETGWKVSAKRCYAWVFTSMLHTVLLYGRKRDTGVLDEILPPDAFHGIGVSDDYAVYRNRFSKGQKCWAHLLRKAIKLMLSYPENSWYREFFEELLAVFREGKRLQRDGRLSDTGRQRKVAQLEDRFRALCSRFRPREEQRQAPGGEDHGALLKELVRCLADDELFTFVLHREVEPTNNISERMFRDTAQARNTNRTSKTEAGAKRRSVIKSVLVSLRQNLQEFSLHGILEEVTEWCRTGISLFHRQLQELRAADKPPPTSKFVEPALA
jgi:transposase